MSNVLLLLEGKLVWNLPLLVGLTSLAGIYMFSIKNVTKLKIFQGKPLFFFLGLSLLYIAIGSPLSAFGHLSFSIHMIQMSIVYFLISPLLLLGLPTPFLYRIRNILVTLRLDKFLVSPKASLFLFAFLFFMYHVPFVLNIFSTNPYIHHGFIFLLFVLSISMWRPIALLNHPYHPEQKKRYALLSGFMLMPACLLFIFYSLAEGMNNPFLAQLASTLCIPSQTGFHDLLPLPFNSRFDQLMGGVFMLGLHKFGLALTFRLGNKMSEGQGS